MVLEVFPFVPSWVTEPHRPPGSKPGDGGRDVSHPLHSQVPRVFPLSDVGTSPTTTLGITPAWQPVPWTRVWKSPIAKHLHSRAEFVRLFSVEA